MNRSPASTTATAFPGSQPPAAGTLLMVVGEAHFTTHPLGPGQTAVLGRDRTCEICLDSEAISRRHARVRGGAPVTVEDLASKNGVRLHGRRLLPAERASLAPGESFQVGGYTVVLLPAPGEPAGNGGPRAALLVDDPTPAGVPSIVRRIAASPVSVLIRGETGVGKEVLARTLHALSGRAGPFLALNCAALGEALVESELFGHERGAFTGAVQAKPGLFEAAAGGTVLLDEVGDLPGASQAKLLRAIEARQVFRLGSVRPVALDVRFLAATHRDLQQAVQDQTFRQDLYYRLNGLTLVVPPLRERGAALAPLATRLLAEAAARHERPPPAVSPAALEILVDHPWPGNVRELKAVIESALLFCEGSELRPEHLILEPPPAARAGNGPGADERARLVAALESCAGNQTRAARLLGISRATLVTKLSIHRLPRPRAR